ncbi:hypothetical protein [Bartonella sp. HY761]|uniref:hypothetical protein n=1 Tax=Bartonella sp. HY761 TaxID=2979330 RepID=UPI0021FA9DEA|nr:hypothetical protein [Bartonella sp. HY761]UXN05922.1 hypothetical protein N6A79_11575 [Bartonella sp. HY761]
MKIKYAMILMLGFLLGIIAAFFTIYIVKTHNNKKTDENITYLEKENTSYIRYGAMFLIIDMNGKKIYEQAPNEVNKLYSEKLMNGYIYVMNFKDRCAYNDSVTRYLVKIYGAGNFTCYDIIY